MSTRIRFRTDARYVAEAKALGREYAEFYGTREEWERVPPAEPGDTWRITWYGSGALAGYDICCPGCRQVHAWTTALNCASRRTKVMEASNGESYSYAECEHTNTGSCWSWSGSAEEGTLSASPSLHCSADAGGCGWHGYLTNGELKLA